MRCFNLYVFNICCSFTFIQQTCLFCSFDDVKEYLQQHLVSIEQNNILDETDKTELYCMYINCLEVNLASEAKVSFQYATFR